MTYLQNLLLFLPAFSQPLLFIFLFFDFILKQADRNAQARIFNKRMHGKVSSIESRFE